MSEEYENLLTLHKYIAEGETATASNMLSGASRAPGSVGPDGGDLLDIVAQVENPTVSAEQIVYDSVKAFSMASPQEDRGRIASYAAAFIPEFRGMSPQDVFAVGQAAETAITRRLNDGNQFNDGPTRFEPDLELELTIVDRDPNTGEIVTGTDGRPQGRTISLDADELLVLGAWVAETRLDQIEANFGTERARTEAEQYIVSRGGSFDDNATTQRVLRDMLADENYTSFAEAFRVGALAATEGQLSEIRANDNNVVEVEVPVTPTEQVEPTSCVGCNRN